MGQSEINGASIVSRESHRPASRGGRLDAREADSWIACEEDPTFDDSGNAKDPIARLSDLLSTPASAQESDLKQVLQVLFRTLIQFFSLDFVYVRAEGQAQETCLEVVERAKTGSDTRHDAVPLSLRGYLSVPSAADTNSAVQDHVPSEQTFKFRFTIGSVKGQFIAGSSRTAFPSAIETLALNLAARKVAADVRDRLDAEARAAVSIRENAAVSAELHSVPFEVVPDGAATQLNEAARRYRQKLVTGIPDWRLREMFDLVPMMAWSSFPNGACEFLNKAYSEYTGLSVSQSELWGWQSAIHPQDLSHRMAKWRESMESGQASVAEARIRRRDGVYRWFVFRIEPFRDRSGTIVRWYGAAADIEDRKRAEENWAASEKRLSLIINTIPMLIWSSLPDGHAEFFNAQWYGYTAFTPSQSDGWGWTAALHPDDYRGATQYWRTVIGTDSRDDAGFEVRLRRSDGAYRWFWLRANAMRDDVGVAKRWYVTGTDIHDRKIAEDGVRRSEALLAEAQRLARLGIFSWRVGSDTMSWCGQLYSMFGFEPGTPITRSMIEERTHPEDAPFIFDKVKLEKGRSKNFEERIRILMSDGSIKYLHYCAYATTALTGEIEYIGTVQDVTEQHIASEALAQARADLGRAARASSLGILTASVAHEVNQPLAGIVTNANTCLRMLNSDPPNIAGAIETARRTIRDGNRAGDVISRLRKLFNHKEINTSWWDLNSAVREVVELVQGDLRRSRVTLKDSYDAHLPLVLGDRIQLQQVAMNLVRNAIDAINMAEESSRTIAVMVSYSDDCAHLSVKDTGVGIDSAVEGKLFDAFFTTKTDGMGIGLSVSRSILEAHSGQMWARNNEDQGATFGFSIPCRSVPEAI